MKTKVNKILGIKCKKTFKEKREILNDIPEGLYCYTFTGTKCHVFVEGKILPSYGVKCCKYWKAVKYNKKGMVVRAKCKLYNVKDKFDQDCNNLLWDQCKICNLNLGKYE